MENWQITEGKLCREFVFKNFKLAIDFVNQVAILAEKINHHPDIFIHSYKKVKISLFTHSENKITPRDHELAGEIDKIYKV
jgi:4a-hydroxytetrahydrobiopterin dehydratase